MARKHVAEITPEYVLQQLQDLVEHPDSPPEVRVKALELLGRHLGLFTDKIEHSGRVTLDIERERSDENDWKTSWRPGQ